MGFWSRRFITTTSLRMPAPFGWLRGASRAGRMLSAVLLAAVLSAGAVGLWRPWQRRTSSPSPPQAIGQSGPLPGWGRLVGRWLRPEGGYLLEIRLVVSDGQVQVAGFKPSPIHGARAEAAGQADAWKLLVELGDVNYLGCIYRLRYHAATETLEGVY